MPTNVNNRWNLVSVPLTVDDYSESNLYPTAGSTAFAYHGVYAQKDTLDGGIGYWMKFSTAQTVAMTGCLRFLDSIDVQSGWNLIGSISVAVPTMDVTSDQPGMIVSKFHGYRNGYFTTDTIRPGKGYWAKVNQNGKLILSGSPARRSSNRIKIASTSEMPPPAPDQATQSVIPKTSTSFALHQNYPNPCNPTTVINYELPKATYVLLAVYDMLGREVAALVNGEQTAGYKSVTWNAANVPSGIYFYRLTAGTFTETKKLLLLK